MRPGAVLFVLGEVGEVGQSGEGGGAGADDGGALACVPGSDGRILKVGDAVGDVVDRALLAECVQAAAAGRAGGGPGSGGVDDGAGEDPLLAALGAAEVHDEGLGLTVGVDDAVPAGARDTGDRRVVADTVTEDVGQGLEVELGPVATGRVRGTVRLHPAGGGEELLRLGVDDLGPGGEQAYVRPVAHRGRGDRSGLQDQGLDVPLDEPGSRGESDRAGADHDDGQGFGGCVHGGLPS